MEYKLLSKNPAITPEFIEKHSGAEDSDWKWSIIGLSQNTFEKAIKEDEIKYNNKINFLLGEKDKNSRLSNFKNNFLFDPSLNKLIFRFL